MIVSGGEPVEPHFRAIGRIGVNLGIVSLPSGQRRFDRNYVALRHGFELRLTLQDASGRRSAP